jgi:hypothetical protein
MRAWRRGGGSQLGSGSRDADTQAEDQEGQSNGKHAVGQREERSHPVPSALFILDSGRVSHV